MTMRSRLAVTMLVAAAGFLTSGRADIRPISAKGDVARLPAGAARLYADTTLFPQPTKWRDGISWMLDLEEGVRVARAEKRPVLIWTSGDDPLERC
jgi:hypothetical protein